MPLTLQSTLRHVALALIGAAGLRAQAQRPILPICSDNPAYKLPPCTAAPGSEPPAAAPAPAPSNPSAQFPFPDGSNSTGHATPPADRFPFPGSIPAAPASSPSMPSAPTPSGSKQPASSPDFPFPGESVPLPVTDPNARVYDPKTDSDVPINHATPPPPAEPAPATPPPSSPSSSSSSDSDTPSLKDVGSEGSTPNSRRRMPKVEDLNAREEEDVKVAKYYHSTGNYQAAYLRAKDALKIDPKDADAQMAFAMNAEKLKKVDEAIAGYTAYLKLEPEGDDAKLAKRSLAALKPQ